VIASYVSDADYRDDTLSVIDEQHLWRMTLGDRRLEREVLQIFVRQTAILLERIAGAEPALAAAAAHTLKGSACGIGAWRMAHAAERLEVVARGPDPDGVPAVELSDAVQELTAAALEVSAVVGTRLRNPAYVVASEL